MSKHPVEQQFRHFLIWVVGFIFIGTVLELILLEHYSKTLQYIPYILSGLGIASLIAARVKPNRTTLLTLRWVMVIVATGSLLGIYFHFTANLEFAREINPTYTFTEAVWPALKGGNPFLAPGILLLAAALGIAITYKHPLLEILANSDNQT